MTSSFLTKVIGLFAAIFTLTLTSCEKDPNFLPAGTYLSADDHGKFLETSQGVFESRGWYVVRKDDETFKVIFSAYIPQPPKEMRNSLELVVSRDGSMKWVLKTP